MATRRNSPPELPALFGLSALFFLRVLGQLLVSRGRAKFLPPMEQWQSGILPYPALLSAQVAILGLQTSIEVQAALGEGALVNPRPRLARVLRPLSVVYFCSMPLRYVISMKRYPERRWFAKTIPIWFHCVLATYLFLWARVLGRK